MAEPETTKPEKKPSRLDRFFDFWERRGVYIIGAGFIGLCIVVAVFKLTQGSTDSKQKTAIEHTAKGNRKALCAISNNLALAFREPAPGETVLHFEDRMRGQLAALLAAKGIGADCEKIQGLANYHEHRRDALDEIHRVLAALRAQEQRAGGHSDAAAPAPSATGSSAPGLATPSTAAAPPSASAPSTPSSSSSSGGSTGSSPTGGNPSGGGPKPPSTPPPPPSTPSSPSGGAVGDVLDQVCTKTEQLLGLCL